MPIDATTLGKRLRQVRVANGFSQAEMAEKMGFEPDSAPIISKIEKGRRKVEAVELHRWATACGTTSDAILNGEPVVVKAAS
jgi:XRE family transcriptional regulator, fatty acid utilization regulator